MIWTVFYVPSATSELADLWMAAPDKAAFTKAANTIDRLLRLDGDQRGIPFHNDRLLVVPPIAVTFSVHPDDCLIKVLQVRTIHN